MASTRPLQLALLLLMLVAPRASEAQTLSALETRAPTYVPGPDYAFTNAKQVARIDQAFDTPAGFTRVDVAAGSFGAWLRGLPVRLDRQHVASFSGKRLNSPSAAIVAIDVGEKNLQQCADSAIRMHAEYLWAAGRTGDLAYHFTSGDEVRFSAWVAGERVIIDGSKVARRSGAPRGADHESMRRWLDLVFMYAGTRSLHRDSRTVPPPAVQPGDFFVAPGSPGHAVMVLDVATAPDGRRVALLGQGYMPAQDFHVIRGTAPATIDAVWFVLPNAAEDLIDTPSWRPFHGADLRRFAK